MKNEPVENPPPFLKSWNQLYLLILVIHALVLFSFWWFTNSYA